MCEAQLIPSCKGFPLPERFMDGKLDFFDRNILYQDNILIIMLISSKQSKAIKR